MSVLTRGPHLATSAAQISALVRRHWRLRKGSICRHYSSPRTFFSTVGMPADSRLGNTGAPMQDLPWEHGPAVPIVKPPRDHAQRSRWHKNLNYTPLPTSTSVRLLKLQPSGSSDTPPDYSAPLGASRRTISCTMTVVDLDHDPHPVYNALSYSWGDPCTIYDSEAEIMPDAAWASRTFELLVDGELVSVGANLYTAIFALDQFFEQSHRPCPWIWIDALCINQQDHEERVAQVRMMSRIFKGAQQTMAWLGGDDKHSIGALQGLASLAQLPPDQQLTEKMSTMSILDESTYQTLNIPYISPRSWLGIYLLLSRSWFQRAWVIQEVALSQSPIFFCGGRSFGFELLGPTYATLAMSLWWAQMRRLVEPLILGIRKEGNTMSMDNAWNATSTPWASVQCLPDVRLHRSDTNASLKMVAVGGLIRRLESLKDTQDEQGTGPSSAEWSLLQLLSSHRYAYARDPRDKIFALLGLWAEHPESQLEKFPVSYKASVAEVYKTTASFIIANSKSLKVLSHKEWKPSHEELPSWVPDFSVPWTGVSVVAPEDRFRASAGLRVPEFSISDANELPLRGIRLGTISYATKLDWNRPTSLVQFIETYLSSAATARPHTPSLNSPLSSSTTTSTAMSSGEHCLMSITATLLGRNNIPSTTPHDVVDWFLDVFSFKASKSAVQIASDFRRNQLPSSFPHRSKSPSSRSGAHSGRVGMASLQRTYEAISKLRGWWPRTKATEYEIEQMPSRMGGFSNSFLLPTPRLLHPFTSLVHNFSDCATRQEIQEERERVVTEMGRIVRSRTNWGTTNPETQQEMEAENKASLHSRAYESFPAGMVFWTELDEDVVKRQEDPEQPRDGDGWEEVSRKKGTKKKIQKRWHLATGPNTLRVRDEVWILAGADVPFLLRPVAKDGGSNSPGDKRVYKLVGKAHVPGFMMGEGVGNVEEEGKVSDIVLI